MNSSATSPVPDDAVTEREAFLADETDARATWDAAVAAVPATAVADRVLPGDRSVKDLVAHIAAWERWAEERLAARIEGHGPTPIPDWHAFEHDFNVRADARWRDEPWDAVAVEAAAACGANPAATSAAARNRARVRMLFRLHRADPDQDRVVLTLPAR